MDNVSKYSQGTVWQWAPSGEIQYNEGVQAGPRPVLIISNNTFNAHSSSVNCLTITSVLKDSPVHVQIHLSVLSHIQCEQVHTIPKKELEEFKGIVSNETLEEVKNKLKFQFNMSDVRETKSLSLLEPQDNVPATAQGANYGEFLKGIQLYMIDLKNELSDLFSKRIDVDMGGNENNLAGNDRTGAQSDLKADLAEQTTKKPRRGRKPSTAKKDKPNPGPGRRYYSDEDKAFILDRSNSLESLVERFGYKDRESAYKVRYYFSKISGKEETPSADN